MFFVSNYNLYFHSIVRVKIAMLLQICKNIIDILVILDSRVAIEKSTHYNEGLG